VIVLVEVSTTTTKGKDTVFAVSYSRKSDTAKMILKALRNIIDEDNLKSFKDDEKFLESRFSTTAFKYVIEQIMKNISEKRNVLISLTDREIYTLSDKEVKEILKNKTKNKK